MHIVCIKKLKFPKFKISAVIFLDSFDSLRIFMKTTSSSIHLCQHHWARIRARVVSHTYYICIIIVKTVLMIQTCIFNWLQYQFTMLINQKLDMQIKNIFNKILISAIAISRACHPFRVINYSDFTTYFFSSISFNNIGAGFVLLWLGILIEGPKLSGKICWPN